MAKKKVSNKLPLRQGRLLEEEKRKIEQLIKFDGYTAIARTLNRSVETVRKYCQRNGLTNDKASQKKNALYKIERSPHFNELRKILTEDELRVAHTTYLDLLKQFGSDVLASEEFQVIDYCIVSCLLNRSLLREKTLNEEMEVQVQIRKMLEEDKARIDTADEVDDEQKDSWYERFDQVEIKIGTIMDELKTVRKDQATYLDRKDKATKSMHGSREQRANELNKANQNWADHILYLQQNPEFRKQRGLEIEKFRLGIREEYIRLASEKHTYADGEEDYPVFNADILEGNPTRGL